MFFYCVRYIDEIPPFSTSFYFHLNMIWYHVGMVPELLLVVKCYTDYYFIEDTELWTNQAVILHLELLQFAEECDAVVETDERDV